MIQRDDYWALAQAAAEHLGAAGMYPVHAVLQCGSGLFPLIDELLPQPLKRIAMAEIPHMPGSIVTGHGREVIYGQVGQARVLVFSGRFHLYEGHDPLTVAFPAAVAEALGAEIFVLTNAAGGLNQHFAAGDLMLHSDYINFQGDNPLNHMITPDAAERFVDPKPPYDAQSAENIAQHLSAQGLSVHRGTYIAVRGPVFETHAELRMMRAMGADVVGMSTVPEVILCNFLRLPVVGFSVVTNECFGTQPLSHIEVVDNSRRVSAQIGRAMRSWLEATWK